MSQVKAKVPFTSSAVTMCVCPMCPVQTRSGCVKSKMSTLGKALKSDPLKPEEIPGLYCASGVAKCQDINFKQSCICDSCPVYRQYNLKDGQPLLYFCRDGASA